MADASETPLQRALRLKNEALAAKAQHGGPGRHSEQAAAAASSSKSKPAQKR